MSTNRIKGMVCSFSDARANIGSKEPKSETSQIAAINLLLRLIVPFPLDMGFLTAFKRNNTNKATCEMLEISKIRVGITIRLCIQSKKLLISSLGSVPENRLIKHYRQSKLVRRIIIVITEDYVLLHPHT